MLYYDGVSPQPEDVFFKDRKLWVPVAILGVLFVVTSMATIKGGLSAFIFALLVLFGRHTLQPAYRTAFVTAMLVLAAFAFERDIRSEGFVFWRLAILAANYLVVSWFALRIWKVRDSILAQPPKDLTYLERCEEARRQFQATLRQEGTPVPRDYEV